MAEYTPTGTQAGTKQGNGSLGEGGLTGAASQAASGLMAQVKSRASSQVAAQQAKAAEGVGTVASALRKAGNELRSQNEGLASYADMAVDELEHISSRIRDKSPGEYLTDLEQFARSRPAAFVGGTFLLGLALARFLKSTQPRRPRPYQHSQGTTGGWPESSRSMSSRAASGRGASPVPSLPGTGTPFGPSGFAPIGGSPGSSGTPGVAGVSDDIGSSGGNRGRGTGEQS